MVTLLLLWCPLLAVVRTPLLISGVRWLSLGSAHLRLVLLVKIWPYVVTTHWPRLGPALPVMLLWSTITLRAPSRTRGDVLLLLLWLDSVSYGPAGTPEEMLEEENRQIRRGNPVFKGTEKCITLIGGAQIMILLPISLAQLSCYRTNCLEMRTAVAMKQTGIPRCWTLRDNNDKRHKPSPKNAHKQKQGRLTYFVCYSPY